MIRPTIIGYANKYFTDCTTWNGGGSNPYLTQIQISFGPTASYSFQAGDVALVVVDKGIYPTQIGWSKIINGTYLEVWAKRLTNLVDNFNSYWTHDGGGYQLFASGMAGFVYRSPYELDALYYSNNEVMQSKYAGSNPVVFDAISRPSFDDSDFYYRIDATLMTEQWGTYYSNYFSHIGASNTISAGTASTYCANTYEFITSPPESMALTMFDSSALSGHAINAYPQTVVSPPSTGDIILSRATLWIRGWNPSSQGVML